MIVPPVAAGGVPLMVLLVASVAACMTVLQAPPSPLASDAASAAASLGVLMGPSLAPVSPAPASEPGPVAPTWFVVLLHATREMPAIDAAGTRTRASVSRAFRECTSQKYARSSRRARLFAPLDVAGVCARTDNDDMAR